MAIRPDSARSRSQPLENRTALVTGASQGIGRQIALRLAAAGAEVCLSARSEAGLEQVAAEIAAEGGSALVMPADLREREAIEALVTALGNRGGVDLLVSNCGIPGPTAAVWEVELDAWEETVAVNVTAPFLLCAGLLPGMIARGSGDIVVIGSATGKRPLPTRIPYATSKSALIGFVRSLAWEVGADGIRVNLISPGPVEGDRLDGVLEAQAGVRGIDSSDVQREMRSSSALQRLTTPEDVAEAVLFLASGASAGITGEDLNVSSGWVMHG